MVLRDQRRRAVTAANRVAVPDVMLQARGDAAVTADVRPLESANERRAEYCCEIRVLAERLPKPRPERLAAYVEHGRKAPGNGRRTRFHRRDLLCPLDE